MKSLSVGPRAALPAASTSPAASAPARSSTKSPIRTPIRGRPSAGRNTPYGRLCHPVRRTGPLPVTQVIASYGPRSPARAGSDRSVVPGCCTSRSRPTAGAARRGAAAPPRPAGSGSVAASSSATSATSAPSAAAQRRGQHVEEAVVGEAGLRVGVPDRVVQPGGELERQLRGRGRRRSPRPAPPGWGTARRPARRCGTSAAIRQPVGPRRGERVQRAQQAPGQRDLGVDVGDRASACGELEQLGAGRAAGPRRAWRPAPRPGATRDAGGSAAATASAERPIGRRRSTPTASCSSGPSRPLSSGSCEAGTSSGPTRSAYQARRCSRWAATRVGQRGAAGREDGGVVDAAGEQRGTCVDTIQQSSGRYDRADNSVRLSDATRPVTRDTDREASHAVLPQRRRGARASGTPSSASPTAASTPRS